MTQSIFVALRSLAFDDGVGGMERAAAAHIRGLRDAGWHVTVFAPLNNVHGKAPAGVELVDVPWPRWDVSKYLSSYGLAYRSWTMRAGAAMASRAKPTTVLHLHGAAAGVLAYKPLRSLGCLSVVNPHGMEAFGKFSLVRAPNRIFLRRLLQHARAADAVIATDRSMVDAVIRNAGVSAAQVAVIPNAVDGAHLVALADGAVANDRFTIVSVGRLVQNKGYDLLLLALRTPEVRRKLPADYRWVHYGSGPEHDSLLKNARLEPAIDLSIINGASDAEVQRGLSTAALFVQPSRYEGSSLTTLEAMVHGRIIVGTAVGGIPDKISDTITGFLAPEATAESLADAIVRALGDQNDVGAAARARVEAQFSAQASADKYLRLIGDLAALPARIGVAGSRR